MALAFRMNRTLSWIASALVVAACGGGGSSGGSGDGDGDGDVPGDGDGDMAGDGDGDGDEGTGGGSGDGDGDTGGSGDGDGDMGGAPGDPDPVMIELDSIESPVPLDAVFTLTVSDGVSASDLSDAISLSPDLDLEVVLDEETGEVTITPLGGLRAATTYTFTISGTLANEMGGTLGEEITVEFSTVTSPVVQVSGAGEPTHENVRIARDAAGNAVAVWTVRLDPGGSRERYHVVYSTYSEADGTWAPETRIEESESGTYLHDVVSNGTDFRLVYGRRYSQMSAISLSKGADWTISAPATVTGQTQPFSIVTDGTGYAVAMGSSLIDSNGTGWEPITNLAAMNSSGGTATSGDGSFLMAWTEGAGSTSQITVKAAICVADSGCGTPVVIDALDQHAGGLTAASRGAGEYAVAWVQRSTTSSTTDRVRANIYNGSWGTAQMIGPDVRTNTPRLAASGYGYGLTMRASRDFHAATYDAVGASWDSGTLIYDAPGGTFNDGDVGIAGNAKSLVVWFQPGYGFGAPPPPVTTRFFDPVGESWGSEVELPGGGLGLKSFAIVGQDPAEPDNSSFAALGSHVTAEGEQRVYLHESVGISSWQTSTLLDTATHAVGEVALASHGDDFVGAYSFDGEIRSVDDTGASLDMASDSYVTDVDEVLLARNGDQDALVVFEQGVGNAKGLLASHFNGRSWSTPELITSPNYFDERFEAQLVGGGSHFVVVYRKWNDVDTEVYYARALESGVWGEEVALTGRQPALASNGIQSVVVTEESYEIDPADAHRFIARTYEAGSFGTDVIIEEAIMEDVGRPQLAARGEDFALFVAGNNVSTGRVYSRVGATWNTHATQDISGMDDVWGFLCNEAECALIHRGYDETVSAEQAFVRVGFGDTWATTGLGSSTSGQEPYSAVATSDGFAVAYVDGSGYTLAARVYEDSAWQVETLHGDSVEIDSYGDPLVAFDGDRVAFVASFGDTAYKYEVIARYWEDGAWSSDEIWVTYDDGGDSQTGNLTGIGSPGRFVVSAVEYFDTGDTLELYEVTADTPGTSIDTLIEARTDWNVRHAAGASHSIAFSGEGAERESRLLFARGAF